LEYHQTDLPCCFAAYQDDIGHVTLCHSRGFFPESVDLEDRVHASLKLAGEVAGMSGSLESR